MSAAATQPSPAARSNDRELDPHVPQTPALSAAWRERQAGFTLATRARRRQRRVVVVGSGLAGAAAAATLSELGFQVSCLCIQDSPRRAHSARSDDSRRIASINECSSSLGSIDTTAGDSFPK